MSRAFPVVLITGPRQVGKTTMLRKIASNVRKYVSLDDPMIKKTANPSQKSTKNFSVLEKSNQQIGTGNVICLVNDIIPADRKNYYVPVSLI